MRSARSPLWSWRSGSANCKNLRGEKGGKAAVCTGPGLSLPCRHPILRYPGRSASSVRILLLFPVFYARLLTTVAVRPGRSRTRNQGAGSRCLTDPYRALDDQPDDRSEFGCCCCCCCCCCCISVVSCSVLAEPGSMSEPVQKNSRVFFSNVFKCSRFRVFCCRETISSKDFSPRFFWKDGNIAYLCCPDPMRRGVPRELSSVGSERLPYKQRVGGSNPSAPTSQQETERRSVLPIVFLFVPGRVFLAGAPTADRAGKKRLGLTSCRLSRCRFHAPPPSANHSKLYPFRASHLRSVASSVPFSKRPSCHFSSG